MIREHRAWRQGEQKAVTKRPQLRKDSQNSWAFRDIISSYWIGKLGLFYPWRCSKKMTPVNDKLCLRDENLDGRIRRYGFEYGTK